MLFSAASQSGNLEQPRPPCPPSRVGVGGSGELIFSYALALPSRSVFCMWLLNFDSVTHAEVQASSPSLIWLLSSSPLKEKKKGKAKLPLQLWMWMVKGSRTSAWRDSPSLRDTWTAGRTAEGTGVSTARALDTPCWWVHVLWHGSVWQSAVRLAAGVGGQRQRTRGGGGRDAGHVFLDGKHPSNNLISLSYSEGSVGYILWRQF